MTSHVRKPFVIDSSSQRSRMKEYEPLADEHLYNFFCSPVVRKTLRRGGLVTRNGEVIRHSANPRAPRLVLPPLTLVPIEKRVVHTELNNKHPATSTGRLNIPKDTEGSSNHMSRKTGSTSDLRRNPDARGRGMNETAGKRLWETGSLKPLSHEEYEKLLQRFCEGEKTGLERKRSEQVIRRPIGEDTKPAKQAAVPKPPQEKPKPEVNKEKEQEKPKPEVKKEKEPEKPKLEPKKEPVSHVQEPAKVETKPQEVLPSSIPQHPRGFSPIPEEKHEPPVTPPKTETHVLPKEQEKTTVEEQVDEQVHVPAVKKEKDEPTPQEIVNPVEKHEEIPEIKDHAGRKSEDLKVEANEEMQEKKEVPPESEEVKEEIEQKDPPQYNAEVPVAS